MEKLMSPFVRSRFGTRKTKSRSASKSDDLRMFTTSTFEISVSESSSVTSKHSIDDIEKCEI